MSQAASQAIAVTKVLDAVMRNDRGRLLSALIARLRDFQLAEEVLHEAAISALSHWGRAGLPDSPQGWLLRVALRKAIDRLRGGKRDVRRAAEIAVLAVDEADDTEPEMIPDERLRLIFTCCHPALEPKSRVALTLRTLGGLTTPEIARAFLDNDTTMGQRLSRAKAKIAAAGIPFAVPGPEDWPDRLNSVLTVVYLIFNAGYTLGPTADRDLCAEAIYLAQMLDHLRPGEAEVEGCLALLLITDARRAARTDQQGATIALVDQDRGLWEDDKIASGVALIDTAMARRAVGPFQIKAAIAACHVQGASPDWPQIAALYHSLLRFEPTAVVRLNHAVALAEAKDPQTGLQALLLLAVDLQDYQPYHAAHADLLARNGQAAESYAAYGRAIAMASSAADAAFLIKRRDRLLL
jgi:RNA polymerase sigma factor (sigma-70 family)